MKKFCYNLKTSDKITFLFSIFNFISLLILLIWINIAYFFFWYSDQKSESMYDMNINYNKYSNLESTTNLEAFREYILQKDTLIIPNDWWELTCSNWVESKIHNDIEKIKDNYFYNNWEKIFFIYSQYYPEIWEVKVFFDTTPYVKSQILIIKISLFIIFFSLFLYIIIWKRITKYAFKNLKDITLEASNLDIEKDFNKIKIVGHPEDEINILANKINKSFGHIKNQASNLKQFITDVSHEFKTPLMVINSKIDLYNKKCEKWKCGTNDIRLLHESVKNNTKKLDWLLETFLFLARIESNIEKLDKRKINISEYLQAFSKIYIESYYFWKNIDALNIKLNFRIQKNIFLEIEENTFNIMFWNLLSNAIKFSQNNLDKNKEIEIEIWCEENSFWVKDNWIWITKENLNKIWDKFFRADTNIEWFWVGLFLVKRLSKLYWAEVEIESKINSGTKFIIKFK